MGYLLILVVTGTTTLENVLKKSYSNKYGNGGFIFTAFVSLFSFLFFLAKYLFTDTNKGDFTTALIPYAIAGAFCYAIASIACYLAYQTGPFALTSLFFSFSIVVTSVLGIIFFNEPLTIWTIVALVLVVVSVILLKEPKQQEEENKSSKKRKFFWVAMVVTLLITNPAYSVIRKFQQNLFNNTVNNEFMLIALALSSIALFIIGFITAKKESFRVIKKSFPYASLSGISNGASNMLCILLDTLLPLSITSSTRAVLSKGASFALGHFLYKEKFVLKQIIGLIIGMIAIVLLNFAPML